jgi:hypothetical protein
MELQLENFNPTKAELVRMVEETKSLSLPDLADRAQLAKITRARIDLKNMRVKIEKTGKAMRDDANKFRSAVIALEKEFVTLIAPEEERLAAIEDKAEAEKLRQERVDLLPHRKERLTAIGDGIEVSNDALLDMDGPAFEGYFNQRQADKNAADQKALDARAAAVREEEAKQQREREVREREERARREERERIEREQKDKEEREQREQERRERQEREETERLEREAHYHDFLAAHGYTAENAGSFRVERSESEVKLYKLIGSLKIK